MTSAIIELNDIAIACHYREKQVFSPGYALLTKQGITTGNEARAQAWLDPQHSFNQYWHQLSMAPLGIHNRHARHFADLAYSQLHQLAQEAGEPKQVIFSVPGSFNHEQLAILLGLAKACGLEATGLVDSAICGVAHSLALIEAPADTAVHVDIQLHNAVITTVHCDQNIRRMAVSPLIGLGLKNLEDAWVQAMASRFIAEYRYDPLHTAVGEQSLRDQLPGWLDELQNKAEITIGLTTPNGELRLNFARDTFVAVTQEKLKALARAAIEAGSQTSDSVANNALLLSHRLAILPGINTLLPTAIALAADSTILGCLAHRDTITNDTGQVTLISSLPSKPNTNRPTSKVAESTTRADATHLLYQHQAYAIDNGLSLKIDGSELLIVPFDQQDPATGGVILSRNQQQLTLTTNQKIHCSGNVKALKAGDTLSFNEMTLELIQVL